MFKTRSEEEQIKRLKMNFYLMNVVLVFLVLTTAVIFLMAIMSIFRCLQRWMLNRRLNFEKESPLLAEKKDFPEYETSSRDSYSILPYTSVSDNDNSV